MVPSCSGMPSYLLSATTYYSIISIALLLRLRADNLLSLQACLWW